MSVLIPPRVVLSWTATALGANFGGYRVYRRRGIQTWEKIGELLVPTGYTAATVEAQHNGFIDYEAGWGLTNGAYGDGWDYAVTVINAATGAESLKSTVDALNVVTPDSTAYWLTSNARPELAYPISSVSSFKPSTDDPARIYKQIPGRDLAVVRTPIELPSRDSAIEWDVYDRVGEDQVRAWRAMAAAGVLAALHTPRGDRYLGTAGTVTGVDHQKIGVLHVIAKHVETSRISVPTQHNLPAGVTLNGTSQYATTPDSAFLNPGAGAFTIVQCAVFPNPAGVGVFLGKGAQGVDNGYWVMHTGTNNMRALIKGATATATLDHNSVSWFDGAPHVAILSSDGFAQALYQDDVIVPVTTGAVTTGAVTIAKALVVGANNAGADGFTALAPHFAHFYYPRVLNAAERLRMSRYLLGYPGYRPPAGASLYADLRDDRTWNGTGVTLLDLTGNAQHATLVAAPATRGIPHHYADLEDYA